MCRWHPITSLVRTNQNQKWPSSYSYRSTRWIAIRWNTCPRLVDHTLGWSKTQRLPFRAWVHRQRRPCWRICSPLQLKKSHHTGLLLSHQSAAMSTCTRTRWTRCLCKRSWARSPSWPCWIRIRTPWVTRGFQLGRLGCTMACRT